MNRNKGIGVFDSGVGGLTVANAISKTLPEEKIIYFGDTAHVPYGDKTETQIIKYVHNIIDFFCTKGIKALVMACNTSSAIVLPRLNGRLNIPTLGVIEFASRMALETSKNERIGVVANPLTVKNGAYKRTIKNISLNGTMVFQSPCKRWVPLIEAGNVSGEEVEEIVRQDLKPLIDSKIDTLILGCTHYPYLIPTINKIMNHGIKIIDPAKAVAEHLKKSLEEREMLSNNENSLHEFFVSGDPEEFQKMGSRFFGGKIPTVKKVEL
ncbi:MAG: glutamate racemase [Candidatus Eremiobacteraeota bacterium]|nr:glutamate racemase [Candidatus Eremiobacteraeota bacterium]